jgi:hypothetical protein
MDRIIFDGLGRFAAYTMLRGKVTNFLDDLMRENKNRETMIDPA